MITNSVCVTSVGRWAVSAYGRMYSTGEAQGDGLLGRLDAELEQEIANVRAHGAPR